MRPKFVLALLLLALLALAAVFLLQQHGRQAAPPAPGSAATTPILPGSASETDSNRLAAPAVESNAVPAKTMTPEQQQDYIDAETARLRELSMDNDPASLSNILADLTNPEKEIREAAIEAAKQFGSTNAIPTLKAVAANTTDTEEQIALLEAANFLSLPSMTFGGPATPQTPEQIQAAAQRRAESKARRQAQMQNSAPNQNPPAAPNQ